MDNNQLQEKLVQLQNENTRLRVALEQSIVGVVVVSPDGTISVANSIWLKMHGYEKDELTGKNMAVLYSQDGYADTFMRLVGKAKEKGTYEIEGVHKKRDGGIIFVLLKAIYSRSDAGGETITIAGQDITRQKRKEHQLMVLKELSERIGYSLNVSKIIEIITGSLGGLLDYRTVSYMTRSEERIIFKCTLRHSVNKEFVNDVKDKMLVAFSAMIGGEISKDKIDESITGAVFDETNKDPVSSFFNLPLIINDKVVGLINVASTKEGLYTEEETNVLYTITSQASSAVTKLEQLLENEKEKLNYLVASLSDGIVMIDPKWKLLVVNPQAVSLLRLKENPSSLDVLGALSEKMDLRTKIEQSMKEEKVVSVDDVELGNVSLKIIVIPIKGKEKQKLGVVVVFRDITTQKTDEKLRDQFTAMMIHELRSPLTNVREITHKLSRDESVKTSENVVKSLSLVEAEASDMLSIVNDLLDIAKIESGKFSITKEEVNIDNLLNEVVQRHKERAESKGLSLEYKSESDLSDVKLDSFRIRQVLTNLITNAVKFTDVGGVTITSSTENDELTLCVADTGVGIDPKSQGKLFSKFQQVHSDSAKKGGTGLGLVISRGIVEAHGGKIWVESEVGSGSKFFFSIPLSPTSK